MSALTFAFHCHRGGISADGQRWVKLPYRKKFLFPVKAVSKRMRKKFAELLKKAYADGKLVFPDELAHLAEPEAFERFVNKVAWEEWVTFVKKPFAGPEEIIQYIGGYTHRIAISNYRMALRVFGRRLSQHVPPACRRVAERYG